MTSLAMISVRSRTSAVSVSPAARLEPTTHMHAAAFVQVLAALERQLAPGGDGMPFGSLTQLATSIVPELIGVQTELRDGRVVGRAPQRRPAAHPTEQFDPVDRLFHART
jgi:hypothetical protein